MRILSFRLYFAVSLLVISSCTFSKSGVSVVDLPEDASPEAAQQIMTIVLRDNFRQKIKSEFPNLTEEQLNGLSVNWRVLKVLGDEKSKLSIVIRMQYGGTLTAEVAKAVTEYGKTIVENVVKNYFKMQPGKSSQQVYLLNCIRR